MTWVVILVIAGIIIFYFLKDRDKMLENQVDTHGGMRQKYSTLIKELTTNPNSKVVKITRDHIQISCAMQTTITNFFITENFNGIEIEWEARLGLMGNHNKKWTFPSTTSNDEIIRKMGADIEDYTSKYS